MNTLNAGNNIHTAQQLSESVLVAKILAVGIYVLAQQSKFLVAIFNRCLNLATILSMLRLRSRPRTYGTMQ